MTSCIDCFRQRSLLISIRILKEHETPLLPKTLVVGLQKNLFPWPSTRVLLVMSTVPAGQRAPTTVSTLDLRVSCLITPSIKTRPRKLRLALGLLRTTSPGLPTRVWVTSITRSLLLSTWPKLPPVRWATFICLTTVLVTLTLLPLGRRKVLRRVSCFSRITLRLAQEKVKLWDRGTQETAS